MSAAGDPFVTFEVIGTPGPQGSKRHVGGGVMVESSKKVKPWRSDVSNAARDVAGHMDVPARPTVVRAEDFRDAIDRGYRYRLNLSAALVSDTTKEPGQ